MTDQQQADLRHDEVEAGTTTGLASPSVDVTSGRQNSLWSDAWGALKRNPLFWIGALLGVLFIAMALVPQVFARGADPRASGRRRTGGRGVGLRVSEVDLRRRGVFLHRS